MVLSDDEQLNKNALMFIYLRENKDILDKIVNLKTVLKDGANVNAWDRNNNNNTALHIAAQKSEKCIVELLLDNGALLFYNDEGKSPVDIAREDDSTLEKEIVKLLVLKGKYATSTSECLVEQKPMDTQNNLLSSKGTNNKQKKDNLQYLKRPGTSGVSGQFYETKLLSLILLKALDDTDIEHFLLATNIRDIGDFDDVCFRYKLKNQDKPVMTFLQAKHRDDPNKGKLCIQNVKSQSGDFGLPKYFDSFLKIKQKFMPDNPDPMFKGNFRDVKCYFILYTPLKENFTHKCEIHPMCTKMHEFIYTGESEEPFQYNYDQNDIDFLTRSILEERVSSMGLIFLDFILSVKERYDIMMSNNLIKIFHPALARKVIAVSEIKPDNYRLGHFRQEFFNSNEDILITLKETLCKAIVINYCKKTSISKYIMLARIEEILNNPCSQTISTLIGDVIIFDDKNFKLTLNDNYIPQNLFEKKEIILINKNLQQIVVTPTVIKDAIILAGIRKLQRLTFKLPVTFGNSDLSIRGNEKKVTNRINFLTKKFIELINKYKDSKIIDISPGIVGPMKLLEYDTLETNGGIGGAVGNLLQYDKCSDMLVFNTREHSLPDKSKYLLCNLKNQTNADLAAYKIKINIEVFPKISFHASQYDKSLAEDFLNKLWFYTGQAKEDGVEHILKRVIHTHCNTYKNQDQLLFNVHSDAIFLRFHDEIQKWWKSPTKAPYLTKSDKLFDEAKKDIVDSPLLTVLHIMCIRQLKKLGIHFKPEAAEGLEFDKFEQGFINIISDAVIFSAVKIMQFIEHHNNYIFINLDYVIQLSLNDYKTMMHELQDTKVKTLVIVSELHIEHAEIRQKLNNLTTHFSGKKIIIVTEKAVSIESEKWLSNLKYTINDKYLNLTYLTSESQSKFLRNYKIIYQGVQVSLSTIIEETSINLVSGKILRALMNNEKIEIGHALNDRKYDKIKDFYINRPLKYRGEELQVNSLNDTNQNVVIISGKPCVGKTILLTHLSLETKKLDPKLWIVRINLAYVKDFQKWQNSLMSSKEIVRFLCRAALRGTDEIEKIKSCKIENEKVCVTYKDDEVPFELGLFINYYNNNQTIFLFDGFDRIVLQNSKECIELLKSLNEYGKRLWITTSSYFSKMLEREFGESYNLEILSRPQQQSFLHSLWETNLKLEKLNHDQFNNIISFIKFIFKSFNVSVYNKEEDRSIVALFSLPMHVLFVMAVEYFKNEISLSPKRIRDEIIKQFNLNSFTKLDRYLRNLDEEESSELTGTPLHMYVAANYFKVQTEDKFKLTVTNDIIKQITVFDNWITSYIQVLTGNLKEICKFKKKVDLDFKAFNKEQEILRDNFMDKHKKLTLYAICKESDINKLLTTEEIIEIKNMLQKIGSGEEESDLIDCVIDGVPIFYHLIFLEYFATEWCSYLLKTILQYSSNPIPIDLRNESIWNCLVNGLLLFSPPELRNSFEYKLKHDSNFVDARNNEKYKKIIFKLVLKQQMKKHPRDCDPNMAITAAINEGLVNLFSLLNKSVINKTTNENIKVLKRAVKSGALALSAVDTSWTETADLVVDSLKDIKEVGNSHDNEQIDDISRAAVTLLTNTEIGKKITDTIKNVSEPLKQYTERVVEYSNNENVSLLVEQLPYHIPEMVNTVFELLKKI